MKTLIMIIAVVFFSKNTFAQVNHPQKALDAYINMKNALVKDDFKSAVENAPLLLAQCKKSGALYKAVQPLTKAKSIEKMRDQFAKVSDLMWSSLYDTPVSKEVYLQYCPMKKASWLSYSSEIQNPYYGSKMLSCGKVKESK